MSVSLIQTIVLIADCIRVSLQGACANNDIFSYSSYVEGSNYPKYYHSTTKFHSRPKVNNVHYQFLCFYLGNLILNGNELHMYLSIELEK